MDSHYRTRALGFDRPILSLGVSSGLLALMAVLVLCLPAAQASVTTGSCDPWTWKGEIIDGSGTPIPVIGFAASSDTDSTDSLISIYLDFSGKGFSTDDLADLSTDSSTSGVGVWRDDGTDDDLPDASDTPLKMESCSWKGDQAQITFADGSEFVPTKVSGSYQWGIVIMTSGTVSDGDQIDIALAAGNIAFSDGTTMPGSDLATDTITVDTDAPGSWTGISPSGWYTASQTPTVPISVRDATSGLSVGSAYYQYSTDGGKSWSKWTAASVSGSDGTTAAETITATKVPFNQDSGSLNLIQFEISDMVGYTGTSTAYTIQIDTNAPGNWANINPSGWTSASQTPDVTISVQDATSGLSVGSAYYQYSTDGGKSWSKWASASVSGKDGSTAAETVTATKVPFNQDSASMNLIQFKINDLAGSTGTSKSYTIQIDTNAPGNWANINPSGWTFASQTPDVTISAQDATSGLSVGSAYYQYSTDGGKSWSKWASASVSGKDGSTAAETVTATKVPFNQDSGTQNQIIFEISDLAGSMGTSKPYTIQIDTVMPGGWANAGPSGWHTSSQAPTVTVSVQDVTSGLKAGSAQYCYSTDGGATWSLWAPATVSGVDGSTGVETITATNVPFDQDSATLNKIMFKIADIALNYGTSPEYTMKVDNTPPGSWTETTPAGWFNASKTPTVTIKVRDLTAGLDVSDGEYRYSTDGGTTWSAWLAATATGADGTTSIEMLTATGVPFNLDSGTLNKIEFRMDDMAGVTGTSPAYTIMIDTASPAGWAGLAPAGWVTATKTPTVTVTVKDDTSGLSVASVQYQYSKDGGASWSDWAAAAVSGTDGTTDVQTVTAANVPFGADSSAGNKIRFRISDTAGNAGTSADYVIKVDTTAPGSWASMTPAGWHNLSKTPTVTVNALDLTAGLGVDTASYQFSTDGGISWSDWAPATVTGIDGANDAQTVTAADVQFNGDSGTLNMIRFRVSDTAGNAGTSEDYIVKIDTVAPAGWTNMAPSGWFNQSRTPTVTVMGSDAMSGLKVSNAQYQFTTDIGATWSDWIEAPMTGTDGTTGAQTLTASGVPFNQDSATLNKIRFRMTDLAGNTGVSNDYTILIDLAAPAGWTAISPSTWFNQSTTPSVTVQVSDLLSGLNVTGAFYQYSTDGGTTWSGWMAATVTGTAGTNAVQTITAANVPFNRDSADQNKIRFRIADLAGNLGTSADYTIKLDMTPPSSSMTAPGAYSKTRRLSLAFTAADNVSGLAKLELWYSLNGGAFQLQPGNITASPVTFEAASDGAYSFYLRGTDVAGNYEAAPATPDANTTVKTTVPEPVVKITEGGDTTETSAHVTGTVEPGSTVLVNGKPVAVDAQGKYSATVPLSEGQNKITVTVTDPAGNTRTVEKTVNRNAAFPMMPVLLIVVIVVVVVAAAGGAMAMRGKGRKGGSTETPATPKNEKEPEEATPVTEEEN